MATTPKMGTTWMIADQIWNDLLEPGKPLGEKHKDDLDDLDDLWRKVFPIHTIALRRCRVPGTCPATCTSWRK